MRVQGSGEGPLHRYEGLSLQPCHFVLELKRVAGLAVSHSFIQSSFCVFTA